MFNELISLWSTLLWPLCRLLAGLAAGLFLASLLESFKWIDCLARLARPLAIAARLNSIAASAFALAAVSPAAANAYLAEKHELGFLSTSELVMANLFNSLPSNLMHLPTIFFLTWPVLGSAAFIYVGLSLLAAIGRTLFTIYLSRMLFKKKLRPVMSGEEMKQQVPEKFLIRFRKGLTSAYGRFRKRLPRLFYFTIPFYVLVFLMQRLELFEQIENWLAGSLSWLTIVKTEAMGIVILQLVAELGASLGACGALLQSGSLDAKDIVIAMLAGNILSTPLRAARHQFPSYAGFYKPLLALKLILANQTLRTASMAIILFAYAFWP